MADGAWLPDGTFRHLLYFDAEKVERLFRAEVLRMLLEKGRIDADTVNNMLSWPHSGLWTHGSVRAEDRQGAVRLGRTMIRCPLVLARLEWDAESGEAVYSARPRRTASPYGTVARWDVLDFIARLTQHIPDPSQQLVRYWGFYSNAARGSSAAPASSRRGVRACRPYPRPEARLGTRGECARWRSSGRLLRPGADMRCPEPEPPGPTRRQLVREPAVRLCCCGRRRRGLPRRGYGAPGGVARDEVTSSAAIRESGV